MVRTVYQKCLDLILNIKKDEITQGELKALIMINIGGCERTIKQAMDVMISTGLIKDIGNFRFKII